MYNRDMWRTLPMEGQPLAELRIEGNGSARDLIVVPKAGEQVRFPSAGEIMVESVGRVLARTTPLEGGSLRVSFTAAELLLERGEVKWAEGEAEWHALWRRARTRSRPWWRESAPEIELDHALHARLTIVGRDGSPRP